SRGDCQRRVSRYGPARAQAAHPPGRSDLASNVTDGYKSPTQLVAGAAYDGRMNIGTSRIILAAALAACAAGSQAQGRFDRGRVEHQRERYATPHWVYDDRFHHNRYYPARGYAVDLLPPGNVAITFRGAPFWYHSGVWYQRSGPRYVVVQPPLGVIVPALPPGYTVVYY